MTTRQICGTSESQEIVANLDDLRELIERGQFHHATYRNHGKLWEGLHVYRNESTGVMGYTLVGQFYHDDPMLSEAESIVAPFGTSVGRYGEG